MLNWPLTRFADTSIGGTVYRTMYDTLVIPQVRYDVLVLPVATVAPAHPRIALFFRSARVQTT